MESGKLSIGDFGDDVTRLHETLNSQGLEASPEEVKRKFFGPSTREAVGEFQKANGIDPTGEICNKTAALLSSPLSTSSAVSPDISLTPSTSPSLGVGSLSSQAGLAQPISQTSSRTPSVTGKTVSGAETNQYKVKGHILLENGLPAQELTIRVYNRGFGGVDTPLGEVKTDDQGFYTLPYQLKGSAANFEVRAINAQGQEILLSDPKFGAAKEEVLNLVAPASIQPLAPEYQRLAADLERELDGLSRLAETQENGDRQDLTLLHQATGWDARLIALTASAVKLSADTGIPQEALYALFRVGLPTDKDKLADLSEQTVTQAIAKARASGIVSLTDEQVAQTTAALKVFARQSRRAAIAPGALSSMGTLLSKSGLDLTEQAIFEDFHFAYQGAELWQQIKTDGRIAPEKVNTLQLQGKLAYLTLNNANLTESLQQELQSPNNLAQLADKDLHRADSWKTRLNALAGNNEQTLATLIPPSYGGEKIGDRVDAYAADLARKVRLTFPTQVVRRTIENDELTLGERHSDLKAPVLVFLENAQPLGFELGRTPIAAFIQQNQTVLNGIESSQVQNATEGIKLLQRLYQITPTDESLKVLMSQGFTSAQDVVAFPYETFLDRFGKFFPSVDEARLTYRKSEQVTTTTFNFFTAAKQLDSAPATFVTSSSMPIREAAKNELIKHYPTMEALFGSLDFCECEHCRSVLSPAAYFVELLDFLDYKVDLTKSHQSEQQVWQNFLQDWRAKHGTATYPFKNPTEQTNFLTKWRSNHPGQPDPKTEKTPYEVLIERRPDLPNLPLTCENTQTALPYIDIVNEILEYYVANDRLDVDSGHDTGLATTPELLAEPQNVLAAAYTKLQAAKYPLTLPFDLWLETVRRFFEHFETPLAHVLEILRPTDELFPPATNPQPYYRSAIWAESLGLSQTEYNIFTNFDQLNWHELYGYSTSTDATTIAQDENGRRIDLNSAKALARRLGVSYKELIELVKTGFVNPQLEKLVILHKLRLDDNDLGIDVDDIFRYKGRVGYPAFTTQEQAAFKQRLVQLTTEFATSGFNAETWLDTAWANGDFDQILVLFDPNPACNFDLTTLQYANGNPADALVFSKLNLLVRLWRKLGWTIAETDRALQVFIPQTMLPLTETNLGSAFKTVLVYLAHLQEISDRFNVGKDNRLKWLTVWSNLSTTGTQALYSQLFLKPSILKNDPVFDDPLGNYLANTGVPLERHLPTLQGALNLTAEEIDIILTAAGKVPETAELLLEHISLLYRYRLLAKALKLPIRELIVLKELSGLDPFKQLKPDGLMVLDDDFPFTQTIKFIEIVEKVKQSGFKPEDLDFLLRHRFDPVGKYRPNPDAVVSLTKTLATEIRRIQSEHTIPVDAASLTDDTLRQKLALVLPADVAATFMAMWAGTIEYEVVSPEPVLPAKKLDSTTIADPSIRITYDAVRQVQRLTFRGVVFSDADKIRLKTTNSSELFAKLLDLVQIKVTTTAKDFFDTQFAGFLKDPSDFDVLFAPMLATLTDTEQQARLRQKREKLVQAFFPFLQTKLIRQFVIQTLGTNLNTDLATIETLLTDVALLTDPTESSQPPLTAFATAGVSGVSASFFTSNDGTGAPITKITPNTDTTMQPTGTNSARLAGYFEVPTAGDYRFFVVLDKQNAGAELSFTHLSDPLLQGKAANDGAEISQFTGLKPGVSYQFTLDVRNLGGGNATLLIQGETLPKGNLSQLPLYPQATVDRLHRAHALLVKTLQLIQGFGLSEREIRYLLTHPDDFDRLDLSQLPTRSINSSTTTAIALFRQFLRLVDYTHLKRDLDLNPDDLITIFENARRRYPGSADPNRTKADHLDRLSKHIADLTRRNTTVVKSVCEYLKFAARSAVVGDELRVESPDFAQEKGIGRLWDLLQLVEKLGVSIDSLASWSTPSPNLAVASDLRNAVKARYERETWQQIAQPIFNKLRQRQRDALVAYIMPKHGFDRLEQLFEYFLIDPGMEPVVQTSRIRLAISSVQLFIQRCLLNLEPQVHPHPSIINSKQWQWMKRYRVWEANRKLFLYPENWLEPEFRDDKTHLFQELEGTLLQGDISNDLAEDAFFNYLKKLEELARLEIVTMYLEEKLLDPATNTLHVIGRTYSIPHKYFYRRYAHQMWTPWEPVTTEIEGDHLVAVVWRDRLHLFWVTFLEKASANSSGAGSDGDIKFADTSFNKIVAATDRALQRQIEVQLNWSEYYQGKWTTRESGGFSNPIRAIVSRSFERGQVSIHVTKEYENGEEQGVRINLKCSPFSGGAFRIVSKNGSPEITVPTDYLGIPYISNGLQATQLKGSTPLQVSFKESIGTIVTEDNRIPFSTSTTKDILRQGGNFSLLMPSNPRQLPTSEISGLVSPFFYQDNQHTFFVEPTLIEKTIDRWEEWIVPPSRSISNFDFEMIPIEPFVPFTRPTPDLIDPRAKFPLNLKQDWIVNPITVLQINETLIGQMGSIDRAKLPVIDAVTGIMSGSSSQGISSANAGLISELASSDPSLSLNVITSNGFNSALLENASANTNIQNVNFRTSDRLMPS